MNSMSKKTEEQEFEISIDGKSILARLKFNEFLYAFLLIAIFIVVIYFFVFKQSFFKGGFLSVVLVAFVYDFINGIKKRRYFLQYLKIEDSGIKLNVFSNGRIFLDDFFDRSNVTIELVFIKERHVSIKLIFKINDEIIEIYEDAYLDQGRMLKLIDLLIESSYLVLNQESISELKELRS